jgi:gliding motility-associated-like protein
VIPTDQTAPSITCPADQTVALTAACNYALLSYTSLATTADNCDASVTVTQSPAVGTVITGTTTVTLTATDDAGNFTTCTFQVTPTDQTAPSITCPANQTVAFTAACNYTLLNYTGLATTADNCDASVTVTQSPAVGTVITGTTTVTLTATDDAGNFTTCTFQVIPTDQIAPSITCPADVSVSSDAGVCEADVIVAPIVATDNCGIATIVNDYNGTSNASDIYPTGTTTVNWTVTDNAGNTTTCSMTVTVSDEEAPTITCPADVFQSTDTGTCEATVTVPAITASDNCTVDTIVNDFTGTDNASGVYPIGSTTVTWTVNDIYGNVSECSMTVNVTDDELPLVTCTADINQTADAGICGADIIVDGITATDNCGIESITNDFTGTDNASGVYPVGTTTVIWTITDIHGNESSCSTVVTVTDAENPVITCPADAAVSTDADMCDALVVIDPISATDNCGIATIANDYTGTEDASATYPAGTTIVTWTVTDIHGNSSTCETTVTVADIQLPSITCPADVTLDNELGLCGATVVMEVPETSDNCGVDTTINDFNGTGDASGFYPVGTNNVIWTATDANGNIATCTVVVQINDIEAPEIICPADITQNNDSGQCGAIVNYTLPIGIDNCADAQTVQLAGIAPGGLFPVGTTINNFEVTDASGNTSVCSFSVTVVDNEQPVIECPEDLVVSNDPGLCGAVLTFTDPDVTDNCGTVTIVQTAGPTSGSEFPVGVTTLAFQATDSNGNVSNCTYTVTVNDTEFPVIVCPDNITTIEPIVVYELPEFSDNCGATITLIDGLESGDVFPHGITVVTYAVTDDAGNSTICSFEILVNTPPVAEDDDATFTEESGILVIDVTANDSDPDGDDFTITSASAQNGIVTINNDGTISYNVNSTLFCGTDTISYVICDVYDACDSAVVLVEVECFLEVLIPEGFSPNGDGVNDFFEILGLEDYRENKLTVFNRWGHKVYEAENYLNDWGGWSDGPLTLGDGILPKGTYFYVLDLGDGSDLLKGYFFLNR